MEWLRLGQIIGFNAAVVKFGGLSCLTIGGTFKLIPEKTGSVKMQNGILQSVTHTPGLANNEFSRLSLSQHGMWQRKG